MLLSVRKCLIEMGEMPGDSTDAAEEVENGTMAAGVLAAVAATSQSNLTVYRARSWTQAWKWYHSGRTAAGDPAWKRGLVSNRLRRVAVAAHRRLHY
jgi:hypothetical protein